MHVQAINPLKTEHIDKASWLIGIFRNSKIAVAGKPCFVMSLCLSAQCWRN